MTNRCSTCKYCDEKDATQGICRYNPPRAAAMAGPGGVGAITVWPVVVMDKDWCRHYEVQLVKPARGNITAFSRDGGDGKTKQS